MKNQLRLFILVFIAIGLTYAGTYSGGSGTSGAPYQISDLDDLQELQNTTGDWNAYFIQTANIDASTTSDWDGGDGFSPIGNSTTKFTGSYDGGGYSIIDLYISRDDIAYGGMFAYCNGATISNLIIVVDMSFGGDHSNDSYYGSLVGYATTSVISNCKVSGSIIGYIPTDNTLYLGGFLGFVSSGSTIISSCASDLAIHLGNIKTSPFGSNGYAYVGGFIGENSGNISECYVINAKIDDPPIEEKIAQCDAGLFTCNNSGNINNCYCCYAYGESFIELTLEYYENILEDGFTTGNSGSITNCFCDEATSKATQKTETELKTLATFTDETTAGLTTAWDFETNPNDDAADNDYWDMDESGSTNSGYPFLAWENGSDISLSVELALFSINQKNGNVIINWMTGSETDNRGFIIERKNGETGWITIASYESNSSLIGQGNTSASTTYQYTDKTVIQGNSYQYRLADVSTDGKIEYHAALSITLDALPELTKMDAAYPNPFNPSTLINYQLAESGRVEIAVYDIRGGKVQTLYSGHQSAGSYNVYWNGKDKNGRNAALGFYFIRMQAGKTSQVQKVMLVK